MSDIMETETEPLTVDKLDEYPEAAAGIVEELRDFLSGHYAELIASKHTPTKWGCSVEMPQAYQDPQHAGHVHNLKVACDSFINAMRGNF
jgi:hypothetical protein